MFFCSVKNRIPFRKKEHIDFDDCVDVLVAGLGTAGSISAIVAAEQNLNVLAVERTTAMGGTGTQGCVWDYYYGSPNGRFETVNQECEELLKQGYAPSDITHEKKSLPGSVKSQVLEQSAIKAGCRIWYETIIIGVYMEENKVVGAKCLHKGKVTNIRTKVLIDCTGEANICRMAGCKLNSGRQHDGDRAMSSKTIGILKDGYVRGVWSAFGKVDVFNAEDLTIKLISSATGPLYLKDYYSEKERMIYEGSVLGVRETYYIDSEENLSFTDVANGKRTQYPAFYAFSQLDYFERDIAFESEAHQDWTLVADMHSYGFSAGIPVGALIPKGYEGLLVAGKGIGIDHDLAAAVRMKKDMEKCGEAAAVLAALSIRRNLPTSKVPYNELQSILRENGCLSEKDDIGVGYLKNKMGKRWEKVTLLCNPSDIRSGLASDNPAVALWSARQYGVDFLEHFKVWRDSSDDRLARNSAIVSGMLGDTTVCDVLRSIVKRIPAAPTTDMQYFPDACKAICLLGRLKDVNSTEILLNIVENNAEAISKSLKPNQYFRVLEDYAFQFLSLSIVALREIANVHPERSGEISARLQKWALNEDFSLTISMGEMEVSHKLRQYILKHFK